MSEASHTLYRETEAAKTLRAQMSDIIGEDEELAADTVEGETDLNEAIDMAVQQMVDDKAAVDGLEAMIKRLAERRDRIKDRMDTMKTAVSVALEQAGRKKIEHPAVTLSLRKLPQTVVITEEGDIPSAYWEPQPPKLNKRLLLQRLKDSGPIDGAALSNGGIGLTVRWS